MVAPLIEIEITWPMLYIIMALPAVLMLSNFVFGSCTVSQFVDEVSGKGSVDFESEQSTSTGLTESQRKRLNAMRTRRRNGKLVVAILFAVTLTQPFVYLRMANNGRCNIVGALFFGKGLRFGEGRCAMEDVFYLGMWLTSVVTYVACILSNPSKLSSNPSTMGSRDAPKESSIGSTTEQRSLAPTPFRCGTCNSVVPHHDHHCFFINNCVGKSNYALFFFFMVCVAANSFYIMVNTWWLVVEEGNAIEIVLGLFTYGIFFGITGLIVFHLLLCRKGVTTSYLLRNHKGAAARLKFLLS